MTGTQTATAPTAESAAPLVRPQGLDHANLHVRDVAAAVRFYTEVLGLGVRDVLSRDDGGRPTFVELGAGRVRVSPTATATPRRAPEPAGWRGVRPRRGPGRR